MTLRAMIHALVVLLLLAGCGPQPTTAPSSAPPTAAVPAATAAPPEPTATTETPSTPTPSALEPLIEAAKAEGQLNVIALPHDWMNYGELISTFAQKYAIRVNELEPQAGSGDELAAIQKAKIAKQNGKNSAVESSPDVVDIGLPFAVQAKKDLLLQPYKVATWDTIPQEAKDADGTWYGDYYGIIVFEVNPKFVPNIPQDWPDLLSAGNKVAMVQNPSSGYQGMMTIYSASLANGGSLNDTVPGLRFFQKMNKAGILLHDPFGPDTIASGETPIALRWDYLALADRQSHADVSDITVVVPKTGVVAGVYAQGISAYAPHPNAAKLWMEFLYSDEGQLLLLKGLGHPIRFSDMTGRGIIPTEMLNSLLPPEPYLNAVFPSAEQVSAADKSVLGSWHSYVP